MQHRRQCQADAGLEVELLARVFENGDEDVDLVDRERPTIDKRPRVLDELPGADLLALGLGVAAAEQRRQVLGRRGGEQLGGVQVVPGQQLGHAQGDSVVIEPERLLLRREQPGRASLVIEEVVDGVVVVPAGHPPDRRISGQKHRSGLLGLGGVLRSRPGVDIVPLGGFGGDARAFDRSGRAVAVGLGVVATSRGCGAETCP